MCQLTAQTRPVSLLPAPGLLACPIRPTVVLATSSARVIEARGQPFLVTSPGAGCPPGGCWPWGGPWGLCGSERARALLPPGARTSGRRARPLDAVLRTLRLSRPCMRVESAELARRNFREILSATWVLSDTTRASAHAAEHSTRPRRALEAYPAGILAFVRRSSPLDHQPGLARPPAPRSAFRPVDVHSREYTQVDGRERPRGGPAWRQYRSGLALRSPARRLRP